MQFSNQNERLSILGVASGLGQKRPGLELAPQTLRDLGLIEALTHKMKKVLDLGDLTPHHADSTAFWDLLMRLRTQAYSVLQQQELLLTIGGDHSIAMATVQASMMIDPNTRVVWVDAHGDINTPATSTTGNLHGMPLAALLGLFKTPMTGPVLLPKNLLIVGARDLDLAEIEFIKDLKIEVVTAEQCDKNPTTSLKNIEKWLSGSSESAIHLSFDIDALDPALAPATGLRVANGLSIQFSKSLLRLISQTQKLISIDFVELNPLQAHSATELAQTVRSATEILVQAISPRDC